MERRLPENEGAALQILENSHLTEDSLEAFSLGRLSSEPEIAAVEEHILVCAYCQTRLEKMDTFVQAAAAGAKAVAERPEQIKTRSLLLVAIAAGLALVAFVPGTLNMLNNQQAVAVDLVAVRNQTSTTAPAGKPLQLTVDLSGLPAEPITWELATAQGLSKLTGNLNLAAPKLDLGQLSAGQYWIRLKPKGKGEVLREFSLLVR